MEGYIQSHSSRKWLLLKRIKELERYSRLENDMIVHFGIHSDLGIIGPTKDKKLS